MGIQEFELRKELKNEAQVREYNRVHIDIDELSLTLAGLVEVQNVPQVHTRFVRIS
jgi:hypothetical protein